MAQSATEAQTNLVSNANTTSQAGGSTEEGKESSEMEPVSSKTEPLVLMDKCKQA
jgi:hypothetical protein